MRVLGGRGARGGRGGQRRPGLGGRTGRQPATRNLAGDLPDPAFARATTAAAAVVVVAGTLGTLWLRGWGRVGFEVPSVPWYFSFPFYVFPHPRLAPGWAGGGRRSTTPGSTRPGSARSVPSPPSCASSRPGCPSCPATPPATRPGRWWCTPSSPGPGRG